MATQKGLGKGLGALFGDINEQTETPAEGAVSLPLQKIGERCELLEFIQIDHDSLLLHFIF